jgi:hypothetical protein
MPVCDGGFAHERFAPLRALRMMRARAARFVAR